jgi:hypothetical protein
MFLPGGTIKYFGDSLSIIDIHGPAGIFFQLVSPLPVTSRFLAKASSFFCDKDKEC